MRAIESLLLKAMVAETVHDLRGTAELTGQDVARRAGISQSKVHKIEKGTLLPSVDDTRALASALDANEETTHWLLNCATRLQQDAARTRGNNHVLLHRGSHPIHDEIRRTQGAAITTRAVAALTVPLLLRTVDYQLAAMGITGHYSRIATDLLRHQQHVLADQDKHFGFVVHESALNATIGSHAITAAQIDRLRVLAQHPNIDLAVVPAPTTITAALVDFAFTLHSTPTFCFPGSSSVRTSAVLETMTGTARILNPEDVQEYEEIYARLRSIAVAGNELISLLDRAHATHLDRGVEP
ncbi:helix-turn-helix domain-containing protein [Solihabitans fulvus]|uniref:Helix-turn-helix domain-containing protein n=1 Tax=Solihabitans fulvus TaxID=1892852 RepID=A0A5B2WSB1_9PSEU|nr:Scr1 family TA system antitoxin-like transcriptional regulator [Solihabitans fulvus]KAA2253319.1 helix-turn-helix domain-containing protein [Solihabitans fulvus]